MVVKADGCADGGIRHKAEVECRDFAVPVHDYGIYSLNGDDILARDPRGGID